MDDWQISGSFFRILNTRWGPFSIDLFANFYNRKCERFYSLFYTPESQGVDALAFSWRGENALMVPPIPLIPRVLGHARRCRCEGVLVAPVWTSAVFWPLLQGEYRGYIQGVSVVKGKRVLEQGRNENSIFGSSRFQGDLVAMRLIFKKKKICR